MNFIGRNEEQMIINRLINRPHYQGCVVYGRRRLGKTELLKHCLLNKGVPCIYYQCNQGGEIDNINNLTKTD